jgi:pyridoxal phosphate enzyme (YggS family)
MSSFQESLESVLGGVKNAELRAGRVVGSVRLIAVSKAHPPESVRALREAGQRDFGENRVQEGRAKAELVGGGICWHFLGHLQRNKVRMALGVFEWIHGVDSLEIARDIDRIAGEEGCRPKVLLEVNLAGEATKFGFRPEGLDSVFNEVLGLERLEVHGLMIIPPPVPEPEMARGYFAGLRALRDRLEGKFGVRLPELSMGMSGDYEVAIEEGATMVRVGTALFGERRGKAWRPDGDGV